MEASWRYVRDLAVRSEQIGYDHQLLAELNLNDIKGVDEPSLDAWTTAAALAAVTDRLELMVAVRPTFHHPALLAKHAASIDHISNGRLTLNVVSAWWTRRGAAVRTFAFDEHDARYERTAEWLRGRGRSLDAAAFQLLTARTTRSATPSSNRSQCANRGR